VAVGQFAIQQQSEPFGVIESTTAQTGGEFLKGARRADEAKLS